LLDLSNSSIDFSVGILLVKIPRGILIMSSDIKVFIDTWHGAYKISGGGRDALLLLINFDMIFSDKTKNKESY